MLHGVRCCIVSRVRSTFSVNSYRLRKITVSIAFILRDYIALVQFSALFCTPGWKLNKFIPSHVFVVDRSKKKLKAINIKLKERLRNQRLFLRMKMSARFVTRRNSPTVRGENASIVSWRSARDVVFKSQFLGRNRWIMKFFERFLQRKMCKRYYCYFRRHLQFLFIRK